MKKKSSPQNPHYQVSNNWILPCSHEFKIFTLCENCTQNSALCMQQCSKRNNPKHLIAYHRPQTGQELLENIFYKIEQSQKIINLANSLSRDYENCDTYFKQINNILETKTREVCSQALKSENTEVVGRLLGQFFQGRISDLKCHDMNMIFNCERQLSNFTNRKLIDLQMAVKSEILKLVNHINEAKQKIEDHFQNTIEVFNKIRKPQQQPQPATQVKPTFINITERSNQSDNQRIEQSDKDKRIASEQVQKTLSKVADVKQPVSETQKMKLPEVDKNAQLNSTTKEVQKKPEAKNLQPPEKIIQSTVQNVQKMAIKLVTEKMIPEEKEQKIKQTPKPQLKKIQLSKPKQKIVQLLQMRQAQKQKSSQTQKKSVRQINKQQSGQNIQKMQIKQTTKNQQKQEDNFWSMLQSYKRTNSISGIFSDQKSKQNQQVKDQLKKKVKVTEEDQQKQKVCFMQLMKEKKQQNQRRNQNKQETKKQIKMVQPSIANQKKAQLQGETYSPFGRKMANNGFNTSTHYLQRKQPIKIETTGQRAQKQSTTTTNKKPEENSRNVNNSKKGFMQNVMQSQQEEEILFVPRKPQSYPSKLLNNESDFVTKTKDPIVTIGKEKGMKRMQRREASKQVGANKPVVGPTQGETFKKIDQVSNKQQTEKVPVAETKSEIPKSYSLFGQVKAAASLLAAPNKSSQFSFLSKPKIYENTSEKQAQKSEKIPPKIQQVNQNQKTSTPIKNEFDQQNTSTQNKQQPPKTLNQNPVFVRKSLSIGKISQPAKKQLPQLADELFQKAGKKMQQQIEKQSQFNQISLHGELQQQSTSGKPTIIETTKQIKQQVKQEALHQQQQQSESKFLQERQKQPTIERKFNFNNSIYLQNRNAFQDKFQR